MEELEKYVDSRIKKLEKLKIKNGKNDFNQGQLYQLGAIQHLLRIAVVSRSLKEKHLDTFEEFLKYHCEKQDDFQYIYKGDEYWLKNLQYIYYGLTKVEP